MLKFLKFTTVTLKNDSKKTNNFIHNITKYKINKFSTVPEEVEENSANLLSSNKSNFAQNKEIPELINDKNEDNQNLIKRRKYALLLGYCGEGYYGLQRNPSVKDINLRTIEDEIIDALVKVNAIDPENAHEMYKMDFQRASRTDKGVSAAENLISLRMRLADDTITKLNEILPKQIRIFAHKRVTKSFDSKNSCFGRTYVYILPTYAFCSIEENLTENFRMSEDLLDKVNETLRMFTGTRNYHNFTKRRKYTDPSSMRHIAFFECSKPFIKNGKEFAVIRINSPGFMLNQIRKMIGLAIAMVRGFANQETIDLCWTAYKVAAPMAPALGLMLDKLHYNKYNRKFGSDGVHQPLDWSHLNEEIEKFKHDFIFSNIIKREIENKSMLNWLSTLPSYHYGVLSPQRRLCNTGISLAAYNLDLLNENQSKKNDEEESIGTDE